MLSDYNNPIDSGMATGGGAFDSETIGHLRTAGKWGRFISITGMAFLGIFLIMLVLGGGAGMLGMLLGDSGSGLGAGIGMTFIMILYGGIIALCFYIYYLLYNFSINAIKVADNDNTAAVRPAFKSLASMFKIVGVLMAIYLVLTAIVLLGMLFFGAAAAL
ncbi:hypothetical protein CEQ90_18400 [Lewinellaceae bacterium SD302]|nr:hypothetical protein CEQ90_18400 [Lewinellaceae bacterium SD302]